MKASVMLLAVLALLPVTVDRVSAQTEPTLSDEALAQTLREGGFNIYFRHAATDWSQSDEVSKAGDWLSCDSSACASSQLTVGKHLSTSATLFERLGYRLAR